MRIETKEIKIYKFGENAEINDKIREYFHSDGFHYEHCMSERIDSLKALADYCDANLDYSLSCVPDRGEFISFRPSSSFNHMYELLQDFIDDKKNCPLTGVCYDEDLREALKKNGLTDDGLMWAFDDYITSIHSEYESMLTDEYLQDHCDANEYEFTEDGKLY